MRALFALLACFFLIVSCASDTSEKGSPAAQDATSAAPNSQQSAPSKPAGAPSAKTTLTEEDCARYEQGSSDSGTCYSSLAYQTDEYHYCEQIEGNDAARTTCFSGVAAKLQDESICDQMTLPYSEDYQQEIEIGICREFVKSQSGIVKKPTTAPTAAGVTLEQCQAMTDQEQISTGQCYFKVAVFAGDYTICDNIQGDLNQQIRIMCYNQVAAKLKDAAVCDRMNVPGYENLELAQQQCRQFADAE